MEGAKAMPVWQGYGLRFSVKNVLKRCISCLEGFLLPFGSPVDITQKISALELAKQSMS